MRRPSTTKEAYGWWMTAVSGERVVYHEEEFHAGYYRRQFRKGGPWVPVEIRLAQEIDPETGELIAPEVLEMSIRGGPWRPPYGASYLRPIPFEVFDSLMLAQGKHPEMAADLAEIELWKKPVRLND